jgi:hypothetical protein
MAGTGVEVTRVGRCGFAAEPTLSGLDHTVNRSRPLSLRTAQTSYR